MQFATLQVNKEIKWGSFFSLPACCIVYIVYIVYIHYIVYMLMEGDRWMWSWERRETCGSIDKAKGLYNVNQDAGEDLEKMVTETGFKQRM